MPEIKLNAYGDLESDDYRWIDMTPLYGSDYRNTARQIAQVLSSSSTISLYQNINDPKILSWDRVKMMPQEDLIFSELSRKALGQYAGWIMENVPDRVEFRGLRIE